MLKDVDLRFVEGTEKEKFDRKLQFTGEALKQCPFLDDKQSGQILQTCQHMMHYECLNTFKMQNYQNRSRTLLIEDFEINEFSCPLCKSYSNTILPPFKELLNMNVKDLSFADYMSHEESKSESKKDSKFKKLLQMMNAFRNSTSESSPKPKSSVMSMCLDIVNTLREKSTEEEKYRDILPVDLPTNKLEIVNTVSNYIHHLVQLVDVKGLNWLTTQKSTISTLLLISHNLVTYQDQNIKSGDVIDFPEVDLYKTHFFDMNVSSAVISTLLNIYHYKIYYGEAELDLQPIFKL